MLKLLYYMRWAVRKDDCYPYERPIKTYGIVAIVRRGFAFMRWA